MNVKKILSTLIAVLGEILIIFCFLCFGRNLQERVLVLNIVVSTFIYALVFIDALLPFINLKDKTQKQIGSIGSKWFFSFFYAILAIGAMVFLNAKTPAPFTNQLIVHGVLMLLLLFGFFFTITSSEKTEEVYFEENQNRDGIVEMKKAIKEIQLKLALMDNVPKETLNRINDLQENLRYLSPGNSNEAFALESEFVYEMKNLANCFLTSPFDIEAIINKLKKCELIYGERKNIYSK